VFASPLGCRDQGWVPSYWVPSNRRMYSPPPLRSTAYTTPSAAT